MQDEWGWGSGVEVEDDVYNYQPDGIAEEHILHHFRQSPHYKHDYINNIDQRHEVLFELVSYDLQMKTESARIEYLRKALEDEQTNINICDNNQRPLIWFALQFHNPRMLRLFLQNPKIQLPDSDRFGNPLIFALISIMAFDHRYQVDTEMLEAVGELFDFAIKHNHNLFFPLNYRGKTFGGSLQEMGSANHNSRLIRLFRLKRAEFRQRHIPRERFDLRVADRLELKRETKRVAKRSLQGGAKASPFFESTSLVSQKRIKVSDEIEKHEAEINNIRL